MSLGSMAWWEYLGFIAFMVLFCWFLIKDADRSWRKFQAPFIKMYNEWRVKYYCTPHDPELEEQVQQKYFKQVVLDPLPDFAKPHVTLGDCLPAYREQVLKMTADELHRRGMITETEYKEAKERCRYLERQLGYNRYTLECRKKRAEIYRDTGKD